MEVPKHIVDVFVAALPMSSIHLAKKVIVHPYLSYPAASAATIVLTATAAFAPSTTSPTRSRVGLRLGET